jgi:K+-sensing histidine kinase KdpD
MTRSQLPKLREAPSARDDPFDANHLVNGLVVTALVGLGLVLTPTFVAVPVLVALAFACGRLGGRDAGIASVAVGALMYGYAITEPHFHWSIENDRDVVLLFVLFFASIAAAEIGARLRLRTPLRQ